MQKELLINLYKFIRSRLSTACFSYNSVAAIETYRLDRGEDKRKLAYNTVFECLRSVGREVPDRTIYFFIELAVILKKGL